MAKPRASILDYAQPVSHMRANWIPFIAGSIAGVLTYGSAYILGVFGAYAVGTVAGLLVGYISARVRESQLIFAGVVGNLTAVASTFAISATVGILNDSFVFDRIDWGGILIAGVLFTAIFVLPGLFGGLWIWEGRKSNQRNSDQIPNDKA